MVIGFLLDQYNFRVVIGFLLYQYNFVMVIFFFHVCASV